MSRVIFSDVDRTILTSRHELPLSVVAAFARAREAGYAVVLATARSPVGVSHVCEALDIDEAICFNGGWIGNPRERRALLESNIARKTALSVMSAAAEHGLTALWYRSDAVYTLKKTDLAVREAEITGENLIEVDRLADLPSQPFKIMCVRSSPVDIGFDQIRSQFSHVAEISTSNATLLEITPPGISKGTAARFLGETRGWEAGDCVAIGDGENDIALLNWAGLAMTVENAIPEIKKLAQFTGPSADDAGMVSVLNWMIEHHC